MQPTKHQPTVFDAMAFASPEAIGRAMLLGDSNAWRLSKAEQIAAVSDALADGAATARDVLSRIGSLPPDLLAARLGVSVATSNEPAQLGSLWRLADYAVRPTPSITLYRDGIAVIEAVAAEPDTACLLGDSNPREILIAHELYHHIETARPECQVSRRWKVTLIKLGRWRWQSGLPVLSEIAAGAFAQALLHLPVHPHALDLVVVKAVNGQMAAARAVSR